MLLVSVFGLTNTVSTDGSVGGIYAASLQLAERTAVSATRGSANGVKQVAGSVNELMNGDEGSGKGTNENQNQNTSNQNNAPQGSQDNSQSKPKSGKH